MIYRFIKIFIILFISIIIFNTQFELVSALNDKKPKKVHHKNLTNIKLIAHACGEYYGMTYTNSLNALNLNYEKGFRFFEVDLNLSSDDQIVLIHDWDQIAESLLGTKGLVYTHKNFIEIKPANNLVLMDIDSLISWLKTHKDAAVITDCKVDNLRVLEKISKKYPNILQKFYIQMGLFNEYQELIKMGYNNIIFAASRTKYDDSDILNFISNKNIYAVSMDVKRAQTDLPLKLKKLNLKVYAHCVNSKTKYAELLNNGVYGIFTDSITPAYHSNK